MSDDQIVQQTRGRIEKTETGLSWITSGDARQDFVPFRKTFDIRIHNLYLETKISSDDSVAGSTFIGQGAFEGISGIEVIGHPDTVCRSQPISIWGIRSGRETISRAEIHIALTNDTRPAGSTADPLSICFVDSCSDELEEQDREWHLHAYLTEEQIHNLRAATSASEKIMSISLTVIVPNLYILSQETNQNFPRIFAASESDVNRHSEIAGGTLRSVGIRTFPIDVRPPAPQERSEVWIALNRRHVRQIAPDYRMSLAKSAKSILAVLILQFCVLMLLVSMVAYRV